MLEETMRHRYSRLALSSSTLAASKNSQQLDQSDLPSTTQTTTTTTSSNHISSSSFTLATPTDLRHRSGICKFDATARRPHRRTNTTNKCSRPHHSQQRGSNKTRRPRAKLKLQIDPLVESVATPNPISSDIQGSNCEREEPNSYVLTSSTSATLLDETEQNDQVIRPDTNQLIDETHAIATSMTASSLDSTLSPIDSPASTIDPMIIQDNDVVGLNNGELTFGFVTRTTTSRQQSELGDEDEDDDEDDDDDDDQEEEGQSQSQETVTRNSDTSAIGVATNIIKPNRLRDPLTEIQLDNLSTLIKIIRYGDYNEFLEMLKGDGLKNLLNVFVDGQTALHYSLIYGRNLAWCKQLVLNGANPNLTTRAGWHPIHLAAFNGSRDTMRYLIDCITE